MIDTLLESSSLIIFDWDGTLIDSHDYIIDTMLMAAEGSKLDLPSREQVSAIIGMSMLPAIQQLFPQLDEQEVLAFRRFYTDFYNDTSRPQPTLFDGVYEHLEALRKMGKQLAVATGKRKPGLLSGLKETETGHFFSELRTADDCASKPAPDMVLSILETMQIPSHEAFVIGDNVLDIKMAQAASVKALGVTTGSSSRQAMQEAGAVFCFDSFRELLCTD